MTNEHIVGKFDDELSRIKSEILEMGDLVIEQIHLSTNAMMSLDTEDIDNLIQKDLKINGMYKTINRHAEHYCNETARGYGFKNGSVGN